jgi:hypothetical protein
MRPHFPTTLLTALPLPLIIVAAALLAPAMPALAVIPPQSTFFATAAEESYSTYQMTGDGDLWPSCWAGDGNLYAANGDGTAFTGGSKRFDMAVSRIAGMPPYLTGSTLATNVGTNWSGASYNRKPTGMVCVHHDIYLAFQNLNRKNFNDAPAASVGRSTDHGLSWTWNARTPMFDNHVFTTIFFLDYGRNYAHAIDHYVYTYGLDNNWRAQQKLFLARVPSTSILNRSAWRFFTGTNGSGSPTWSPDITAKKPVLEDDRVLYPRVFGKMCCPDEAVIGQGGVTYDAPLQRYIFTSWTYATHQFYEAPRPWGPWKLFLSHDFGPLQGLGNRGMYGTSIPSKFISADGKTLSVQSNVCCRGNDYTFSLRKLYLQPFTPTTPANGRNGSKDLAITGRAVAISKSTRSGRLCGSGCFDSLLYGDSGEDDYDLAVKPVDWWGYTWNHAYNMNKVTYTTGTMQPNGGWYGANLRVQARQHFTWVDVTHLSVTPAYPYSHSAGSIKAYTFRFTNTWGDGVRIIGTPGGSSHFTSITKLAVYYAH